MSLCQHKKEQTIDMTIDLKHIFVTSDHHFGSYKMPGFLKVFTQEQEVELIGKWNNVVGKDDLVYYNGDFCDGTFLELRSYLKKLNGNIVLVRGNHDAFSDGIYAAVFKNIVDSVIIEELDLTIHHCPGIVSTKNEVFGHLHRCTSIQNIKQSSNRFCSCVQSNDGYPISLDEVMQYFK